MKTIRTIAAILAIAVTLKVVIGISIITTLAILALLWAAKEFKQRFGEEIQIGASWLRTAAKITAAIIGFVVLRFLLGQVLGLYPVDARDAWSTQYFKSLYWGHIAPRDIVIELVLILIIAGTMWGWLRGKLAAKTLIGIFAIAIVAGVIFPGLASTLLKSREGINDSFAKNGVIKTVRLVAKGPDDSARFPGYGEKHCSASSMFAFLGFNHLNDTRSNVMDVPAGPPGCFHGPFVVPASANVIEIAHSDASGDWAAIWCNGKMSPSAVHPAGEDFTADEITGCKAPTDPSDTFYVQGGSTTTITVRVLSRK